MPASPPSRPSLPALRRRPAAVFVALWIAGCAGALAQGLSVSCPMRVQSQRASLAEQVPEGFRAALHAGSLAWLTGVTMYDGAPQDGRVIESRTHGGSVFWTLEDLTQVPVIVCRYEGGIALGRQLSSRVRQCAAAVVRGRPDAMATSLPERTVIQCQ